MKKNNQLLVTFKNNEELERIKELLINNHYDLLWDNTYFENKNLPKIICVDTLVKKAYPLTASIVFLSSRNNPIITINRLEKILK